MELGPEEARCTFTGWIFVSSYRWWAGVVIVLLVIMRRVFVVFLGLFCSRMGAKRVKYILGRGGCIVCRGF